MTARAAVDGPQRARAHAINALAWVLWLGGAASVPLVSRNPLYLVLDLLVALVVYLSLPRRGNAARAWRLFATVGVTLAVLSIGFNVLTVHAGDRAFATLPGALPIIGGRLTWNALAYGSLTALAIATLLIAAAAFNTAVRQGDLIRLIPGRFAGIGIAGSIALTMVPQTIAAGRDIYDAQRARGHRIRSTRDATSFLAPLLGSGLERALALSEALETRGFGAPVNARPSRAGAMALSIAAALLVAALVLFGIGRLGLGLVALVVAATVAVIGRGGQRRTRYRSLDWNAASVAVAWASLATPITLAAVIGFTGARLAWDPFPRLTTPPFEPVIGAAVLLLLAPLFWPQP